jgi:hypothetical protein
MSESESEEDAPSSTDSEIIPQGPFHTKSNKTELIFNHASINFHDFHFTSTCP